MPRKKAAKVEPIETLPVVQIQGYRRAPRYEEIEYRPDELPEDQEGLKVTIRSNLTFAEVDEIPYGLKVKFADIWPVIAPYVIAWNVMGENVETGEWEPVPPPAEAGVSSFDALEDVEALWLILAIKFKHRQKVEGEEAGKDLTTSEPSDSP